MKYNESQNLTPPESRHLERGKYVGLSKKAGCCAQNYYNVSYRVAVASKLEKEGKRNEDCMWKSQGSEGWLISHQMTYYKHAICTAHYCLMFRYGQSVRFTGFSLFIVPSPFSVHCPYKGGIDRAKGVLTGLIPY